MSLAGVFLQNDSWNKSNHLTIELWMLMQFLMHFLLSAIIPQLVKHSPNTILMIVSNPGKQSNNI